MLHHKSNESKRLLKSHMKSKKFRSGQHTTPTKRKLLSERGSDNSNDSSNVHRQAQESGLKMKSKSLFKKHVSINTNTNDYEDEKSSAILPFGNLLETPTRE